MIEIAAHYDGRQVVFDEPAELAAGARLTVKVIEETPKERHERVKAALRGLAALGKSQGISFEGLDLEDRDTYYDDFHRAGLDQDERLRT